MKTKHTQDTALQLAYKRMKRAGVTGIKLELEADLQRLGAADDCPDCHNASGYDAEDCEDCGGTGLCQDESGESECYNCDGTGEVEGEDTCDTCSGDGSIYLWRDKRCLEFVLDWLDTNTSLPRVDRSLIYNGSHGRENTIDNEADTAHWLRYMEFYKDGSVDSELTFTVRTTKEEYLQYIPEVVRAFNALAEAVGGGMNVDGAGLHMALVFATNASYPVGEVFNYTALNAYRAYVTPLLPALYALAAYKPTTRGISRFRAPNVSVSNNTSAYHKYSAINVAGGSIEFRVFDTFYHNPLQAFDNIIVMSKTLQYLRPELPIPDELIRDTYCFGMSAPDKLADLYTDEENIDRLNAGIKKLLPEHLRISEVKKCRELDTINKRKLKKARVELEELGHRLYQEWRERQELMNKYDLERLKARYIYDHLSALSSQDFGTIQDTPSEEYLEEMIQHRLDQMAREIHDNTLGNRSNSEANWVKNWMQRRLSNGDTMTVSGGMQ